VRGSIAGHEGEKGEDRWRADDVSKTMGNDYRRR
jgi:hypothetical protein